MAKEANNEKLVKKPVNSLIYMFIYIILAMIIVVGIKSIMKKEEPVSIATNDAEIFYYNNNYDAAIKEYEILQGKEEWPQYEMEIAKMYSAKGDFIKSNETLLEVYEARNKSIDDGKIGKYTEEDENLVRQILFTAYINGDLEKALEYCEVFMMDYKENKEILNIEFMIYMVNGKEQKANEILDSYPLENATSTELSKLSRMNALIGKYEDTFGLLEKAWNIDNNDILIMDTIGYIYSGNKELVLDELKKYYKNDKNNEFYNICLAKIYSLNTEDSLKGLSMVENFEDRYKDNLNIMFIKAQLLHNDKQYDESEQTLKIIYEQNKDTYIGHYAKAINYYNIGKYEMAFNESKRSILLNRDYFCNYGILIPKILDKLKQNEKIEPYFRDALEIEPYNCKLIRQIAEYYKDVVNENSKSLYYYELLFKINSEDASSLYEIGRIKINTQRIDEAVEIFEKCMEIDKENSDYNRAIGAIYLNEEKNDKAIKEIREAYSKNEEDILNLNNAGCYYISVEHNIGRSLTNFKAAYDGINENTTDEEIKIIVENYNRVRALDKESKVTLTITDFKLFY